MNIRHIAIFASGFGRNAENIIRHFEKKFSVKIELLVCNNPNAFVLERVKKFNIPVLLIDKNDFYNSEKIVHELQKQKIDWIILAGFLWLLPKNLLHAFPNKIINIHPALLPKFGGKGMYGMKVHEAVLAAKEKETGITIHFVNENYDEGKIIFQAKCKVEPTDTVESLAQKIHQLELTHFPKAIEEILK